MKILSLLENFKCHMDPTDSEFFMDTRFNLFWFFMKAATIFLPMKFIRMACNEIKSLLIVICITSLVSKTKKEKTIV